MGEGYRFWLIGDILSYCASRFGNRSLSRRKRSRKSLAATAIAAFRVPRKPKYTFDRCVDRRRDHQLAER